jgi:hypothetical protein
VSAKDQDQDPRVRVGDSQYGPPLATAAENQPIRAQHTPGPWGIERTNDTNWIGPLRTSGDGKVAAIVCSTDREGLRPDVLARNDADAAFIVRAVNAHDELVAALKRAVETIRAFHAIGTTTDQAEQLGWSLYQQSPEMRQINAALAKAEG